MLRVDRAGALWMLARDGLYAMPRPGLSGRFERRIEARQLPHGLGEQLVEDDEGVVWTGRCAGAGAGAL